MSAILCEFHGSLHGPRTLVSHLETFTANKSTYFPILKCVCSQIGSLYPLWKYFVIKEQLQVVMWL